MLEINKMTNISPGKKNGLETQKVHKRIQMASNYRKKILKLITNQRYAN